MATVPPPIEVATADVREDMVAAAARFLQDPKVNAAPLAKKTAFLESKGLTGAEISAALARSGPPAAAPGIAPAVPPPPAYLAVHHPPPRPAWSVRDYTLAAAAAGGLGYAAYYLIKTYVLDRLPSYADLTASHAEFQRALKATSDAVDAVQADARAALASLHHEAQQLEQASAATRRALDDVAQDLRDRNATLDRVVEDMLELKEKVPAMLVQARDAQAGAIADLQAELRGLRTAIDAQGGISSNSPASKTAALPAPPIPLGKPGILPEWQRKAREQQQQQATKDATADQNPLKEDESSPAASDESINASV